jgi:hypothetical protein
MLQRLGRSRSLQTARAHFFREDELQDLEAFLLPCFVSGWDAFLVPFGSNEFCAHVSHDEYWAVVARRPRMHGILLEELSDLNPVLPSLVKKRFCCPQIG